jgi:uncharacterized protein YqhQ
MEKQTSCFRTSIGGQALMEGILMRGPKKQAIVCRTADGLVEKTEELVPLKEKSPVYGWPFVRGCVIFISSLVNGMKALSYSASLLPEDEQEKPSKLDLWIEEHFPEDNAMKIIMGIAVVLGLALAVGLFIVLPTALIGLIKPLGANDALRTLCEGVLKVIILLVYMALVARVPDIQRVFRYHGAEHKTIFCYEHGRELTVENVRPESRFHPRCGTSFLLVVVLISILVNMIFNALLQSVLPIGNVFVRMLLHLLLLPLVVGISYEINRWCGAHDNVLSAVLSAPGKWLQHITTAEPDDGMIECAIRAMELVIPEEKGLDDWSR